MQVRDRNFSNKTGKAAEPRSALGAAPQGAADPQAAARAMREMFTSIAPRYDLLNHLLSFNIDRLWWKRAAQTFSHLLNREGVRVLDLCCGTGDMTFALHRQAARKQIGKVTPTLLGADFSHAMLVRAGRKSEGTALRWIEADALRLPLPDRSFDLVTSAFGFRNLNNYDAGLHEIFRILRPGGEVGILDFGEPRGLFGTLYRAYFRHVLPTIGTLVSGVRGPYSYLPASVERFPSPDEMLERMHQAGFESVTWTPYTLGVAGLYRGKKDR